ncbi:hypothetical protein SHD_1273 [Shewanella decolorationis S12]|uniref:Uncharacterized protein n=1 Tax=Shewanella decolorationis S12 TaxID=1353536 RepID=A0ABN0PPR7_9GAMM|nr:hypothetical protein SHD_1273 [Shewanella decolorationis S12]
MRVAAVVALQTLLWAWCNGSVGEWDNGALAAPLRA